MIKIRYASLPEGLHAQARWESGQTIIYLRPGLTSEQRREALRRARQTARMGHGPQLPAASLALALAADRARSTLQDVIAAIRCHPVGAAMLAALVAGAVVSYSLFVTVSVHLIYPQVQANLPHPSVSVPVPVPGKSAGRPRSGTVPGGSSAPGGTGAPSASSPVPGPSRSGRPTPAPSPSTRPSSPVPSPSPSGGVAGVCVKVGPLGVCLSL